MTTTIDSVASLTDAPSTRTAPPASRGWALAGTVAGVLGVATFALTGALSVETDALADNARMAELLTDKGVWVWLYQVLGVATALLVAVFGTGLHRRLAQQSPAGSLAPQLSLGGLWLTAALTLVGSGICTELFHGLRQDTDAWDPDTLAATLAIFNTMGWVWIGAVLATASIAHAGLKHGSVSRGLAIGSAVASGLLVLTNLVPFQYLAMPVAALWMIGAGISFARAER